MKTRSRNSLFRRFRPSFVKLEDRAVPAVATFQQGVNSYAGTQDAGTFSDTPNTNLGNLVVMSIDNADGNGIRQSLLRFDDMFGPGLTQIPLGSKVTSAVLDLYVTSVTNISSEMGFYRMKQPWAQNTVTYNSILPVGGVQTDGVEAEIVPDYLLADSLVAVNNNFVNLDVTTSLKAWATGTPNFGWLISQYGTNGWDIDSSEGGTVANRPKLTITYDPPVGNGEFQFAQSAYQFPEGDTGSKSYTLLVTRSGGVSGPVSVDYTIDVAVGPGIATAGLDYDNTVISGTLNFNANEVSKPVTIKLLGDTIIEGPETFTLTLSNALGGASIASNKTTITINDNDVLLNEVFVNLSGANDDGYEYIEITAAPNAVLPSNLYLVAFDSTTEGTGGIGNADLVVDLSGTTVGSNGLLLVTPTTFKYSIPVGTTQVIATQLNSVGGGLVNTSESFALVLSAGGAIVQGTDYDTSIAPFLNDGVLESLPAGAALLDVIGSTEGPNSDQDRIVSLARPASRVSQPGGIDENAGKLFVADAYTRRFGDRTPNNPGSWYNGEITSGTSPVYSLPPLANVNIVAGAQLTPGGFNLPRAIEFAVTSASVNEAAGTVTVIVNRLGENSVYTSVDYATADGTAKAGQDYTTKNGKLEFLASGNDTASITVNITPDTDPEGFESFVINLSNPGTPFLLTNNQTKITINDDDALVATFQDGDLMGDYAGTRDVGLYGWLAGDKLGSDLNISVDRSDDDPSISSDVEKPDQALLRFDDLFGAGLNQIPVGSTIYSAFITFNVTDAGDNGAQISLHRMLSSWSEFTASFSAPAAGITNGVTPDDVEARSVPDGMVPSPGSFGLIDVPVSIDAIQAWANGTAVNNGWAIMNDTTDGWDFDSSDQIGPGNRPKLTLVYTPPSGTGTVRFADPTFSVNENGGNATLTVQRAGATSGTQTINWGITGGTATGADYTGPSTGSIMFGPTDLSMPITIPIVNDGSLERNETLVITLTGSGVTFTRDVATLVIRDNDFVPATPAVLLNEVNSNPPGTDAPYEFGELIGTANAAMGGLYFVSMRGDGDVFMGNADVVTDLSAYFNGTNGFTMIKAGMGGFTPTAGATVVNESLLDTTNLDGSRTFNNTSNSFLLIYSPTATISSYFDYDWANTGTLDLPAGAVIVDAVGWIVPASTGKAFGGAELVQSYTPQAASRIVGDSTPMSAAAWFRGSLGGNNDSLAYGSSNTALPVTGATLTPGGENVQASTPLTVQTAVTIDDGSPQRSMVRSLTVTFSNPIQYMAGGAFTLTDQLDNPISGVSLNVAGLGTSTFTLTFSGSPIIGQSLADGKYRLKVNGSRLTAGGRQVDANNDTIPGSNSTTDFHRYFGDVDGDGTTANSDFNVFRSSFGGTDFFFDYDGDGSVSNNDFNQLKSRFGGGV